MSSFLSQIGCQYTQLCVHWLLHMPIKIGLGVGIVSGAVGYKLWKRPISCAAAGYFTCMFGPLTPIVVAIPMTVIYTGKFLDVFLHRSMKGIKIMDQDLVEYCEA